MNLFSNPLLILTLCLFKIQLSKCYFPSQTFHLHLHHRIVRDKQNDQQQKDREINGI